MLHAVSAPIVTAADGTATVLVGSRLRGRVHAIKYTKGSLDAGTDLVITGELSGVAILTDSPSGNEWFYPRAFPNQATDGAAGTVATEEIHVLNERIQVAVVQGGNAGAGSITVYLDAEV
jgi:hypothetical protein